MKISEAVKALVEILEKKGFKYDTGGEEDPFPPARGFRVVVEGFSPNVSTRRDVNFGSVALDLSLIMGASPIGGRPGETSLAIASTAEEVLSTILNELAGDAELSSLMQVELRAARAFLNVGKQYRVSVGITVFYHFE